MRGEDEINEGWAGALFMPFGSTSESRVVRLNRVAMRKKGIIIIMSGY